MFRKAGISDADLVDSVRNQVAINFALSVIEDRYDPMRGTVGAYLWGVVYITCLSEIRRYKRFPKLGDFNEFNTVVDGCTDPAEQTEKHELQQIIRDALVKLPLRYRVALCVEYGTRREEFSDPSPLMPERPNGFQPRQRDELQPATIPAGDNPFPRKPSTNP